MGVVDLTVEMERRRQNPSPCDGCEMGFGSIGQYIDVKTGHLMQESHDCMETCQRFRNHWNKPSREHIFGQNIRDAIAIIKGK